MRLKVYEYLLPFETLHVRWASRRFQSSLRSYVWLPENQNRTQFPASIIVRLLLVCRAMYTDVITILFQDRTFEFTQCAALLAFTKAVPEHRFNSIRRLIIDASVLGQSESFVEGLETVPKKVQKDVESLSEESWPQFSRRGSWVAACWIINGMESLKNLKVFLSARAFANVRYPNNATSGEKFKRKTESKGAFWMQVPADRFIFQPLVLIKKPQLNIFVVEADWAVIPWEILGLGDKPFVLRDVRS